MDWKPKLVKIIDLSQHILTLPIFRKIFEKIIYKRLYSFLSQKGILSDSQFGFRTGHSTGHAQWRKGLSTKDVRQNLGFSNHPLPLSGCVRISKTTPLPGHPRSDFSIFKIFSIFTHFYFCYRCFYFRKHLLEQYTKTHQSYQ